LVMGGSLGRFIGLGANYLFPDTFSDIGIFALVGQAAYLGGVTRMTISFIIILLETTRDGSFALPITVGLFTAVFIGNLLFKGSYDLVIQRRNIPFLNFDPHPTMALYKAKNIMNSPAICFKMKEKVDDVYQRLQSCKHHGFPIVSKSNHLIGLICRYQIITILHNRAFVGDKILNVHHFEDLYPFYPSIESITLSKEDLEKTIDFTPYFINPYIVFSNTPVSLVYNLFRTMGLRHIVVINKKK